MFHSNCLSPYLYCHDQKQLTVNKTYVPHIFKTGPYCSPWIPQAMCKLLQEHIMTVYFGSGEGVWVSCWVKSEIDWVCVIVTQSCPTLYDPIDYSPPGSFVHEILPVRILEWVTILFSRRSSQPTDQTQISCILGKLFTIWTTREAPKLTETDHNLLSMPSPGSCKASVGARDLKWLYQTGSASTIVF